MLVIRFSNGLRMVAIVPHSEDVKLYATELVAMPESLQERTEEKTEAVMITNRNKKNTIKMEVGGCSHLETGYLISEGADRR